MNDASIEQIESIRQAISADLMAVRHKLHEVELQNEWLHRQVDLLMVRVATVENRQ